MLAFFKGCLEGVQPQLVQALVPLAAAFAAWSFCGSISINGSQSTIGTKILVSATGGFAVWLVTAYILIPRIDENCRRGPSARENLIDAVSGVRNLRAEYAFSLHDGFSISSSSKALAEGRDFVEKLARLSEDELSTIERVHKNAYAGVGYLYLALLKEPLEKRTEAVIDYAKKSLEYSEKSLDQLRTFRKEANESKEKRILEQANWADREQYDQFVAQNIARSYILLYKLDLENYEAALAGFMKVDNEYIAKHGLAKESIYKWFCLTEPSLKAKVEKCKPFRNQGSPL